MNIERFVIDIEQSRLDELAARLNSARVIPDFGNSNWEYGTNTNYLSELVEYWRKDYDWRKHEKEMNQFEHFKTEIDGLPIHFLYKKVKGPSPTPLLLTSISKVTVSPSFGVAFAEVNVLTVTKLTSVCAASWHCVA